MRYLLLPPLVLLVAAVALLAPSAAHSEPRLAPASLEGEPRFESLGMRNLVTTLARYPELAQAALPYSSYLLAGSSVPARDRELLWLRTAWLARSGYLWAQRAPHARAAGITSVELKRIAIGPGAEGWGPFDAALVRAADELHVDAFVTDGTWRALAERYDERQLIDLLYGVGEIAMLADLANTLRVDIEPELEDRLPAGVPYVVAVAWPGPRLIGEVPRIAPLERDAWSGEVRELLDPAGAGRPVPNVFRTFARHPPTDTLRNAVGGHIRDATSLEARHRQLLITRTAVFSRSEYEWAVHARIGRQVGVTDAEMTAVLEGPSGADDIGFSAVLLRAVDELHRDNALGEETWDALAAELDERQLLDVIVTVGGYRSAAYAINSTGVQLDDGMEALRFPPELR